MKDIAKAIKQADYVYIAGNGGSASTANHFANDLVKVCGVKAISLSSNEAIVTAYANDTGYENIFYNQLKVFLKNDDLLITISGSGISKNIVKAIKFANQKGIKACSFPTMKEEKCTMFEIEDLHLKLTHRIVRILGK